MPNTVEAKFGGWTTQQWAENIHDLLDIAKESIIKVGSELIAAKDALPHGEWMRMFAGHPDAVADPIPLSIDKAEALMQIARHPVLANSDHWSAFPESWRTMQELAKIPAPALEQAIAEKKVTPTMTRKEAIAIREADGESAPMTREEAGAIFNIEMAADAVLPPVITPWQTPVEEAAVEEAETLLEHLAVEEAETLLEHLSALQHLRNAQCELQIARRGLTGWGGSVDYDLSRAARSLDRAVKLIEVSKGAEGGPP